jgi:hypothetical protein
VISAPDLSIALFRVSAIAQMQNPRLHAHYVKHGVDIGTTVCHKWIVTMFIDPFHSLSPEFAYRILDMFFVHGPDFLIRLSVAIILYKPHAGASRDLALSRDIAQCSCTRALFTRRLQPKCFQKDRLRVPPPSAHPPPHPSL